MATKMFIGMTLPRFAFLGAAAGLSARVQNVGLLYVAAVQRPAAHGTGGILTLIPPLARLDVNNCTACQSPGRGRPH